MLASVDKTEVNLKYNSMKKEITITPSLTREWMSGGNASAVLRIDHDVKKNSFSDREHIL